MILALADDLTGALEVGARFPGSIVTVSLTSTATIIDTETRHLSAERAASRVRQAIQGRTADIVYKKTDSTLRGNIGAELQAIAEAFPDREIVFIPAYPAMGRTCRNGQLYVEGIPLHKTAFARDPLNPVTSSRVTDALQGLLAPIRVIDAETEEEVAASIPQGPVILAGPANVAGQLWGRLETGGPIGNRSPGPIRHCLVINGSLHPASAAQFHYGQQQSWPNWTFTDRWTPGDHDTVIVFGGDTAFGVLQALGATELTALGEVVPGVALSRIGGLQFITKAGGFGTVDILERIQHALRNHHG